MAGYWPSSFCVFIDRDGVEVHKHTKKEQGQYPSMLTEQALSLKDLLYGFHGNSSCGTQLVIPSEQDSTTLPAREANHRTEFGSSARYGSSHVLKHLIAHDVSRVHEFYTSNHSAGISLEWKKYGR